MSEKKKMVPVLRFPGFSGEWEERKVLDVAPLQRGFDLPKIEMQKGDYPVVMSNGINGYHSDYKAKAPGVVTGRSGTLGNLHYIELNYWPHNTALWVTDFKGNEPLYIYYMYQKLDLIRFGTGSGVPTLNRNDVHATKIYIPNPEEQEKISSFLRKYDNLITLHQRQLTHLQTRKKGLLQKMFPKDGELFPELRFPGFTDTWEQRKLGELGSVAMNKRIYKDQTTEMGDVPFYKIGTFGSRPDAFITRKLFEEYKAKYPYPKVGDILISASGSIGRTVEYKGEDEYFQDSNIVWLDHDGQLDNSFLKQFYSIVKWRGLEGSTIKRLYNKNILDTEIIVPKIEEQFQIGAFFKQLDDSITLHQRKLDHLQARKKALLQQMFV